MKIRLPWIEPIDTDNLPDNLKELVRESFSTFTAETSKDYTFEDKLLYIDNMRKYYLRDFKNTNTEVDKLLGGYVRNQIEFEDGLSLADVLNTDFMEHCFDKGFMPLYSTYDTYSHSRDKEVKKAIVEIIKIVINFERPVEEE